MITDTDGKGYRIMTTEDGGVYEGIRSLWCAVFGDEPGFVDHVYRTFGRDIRGYAAAGRDGAVVSALTVYRCGSFEGKPVWVTYAVCTAPEHRGHGLAGMLTERARDDVISSGAISIVSPDDEELADWYGKLGYVPCFYASERAALSPEFDDEEFDDFDGFDMDFGGEDRAAPQPAIELKELSPEVYSRYREAFLDGRPHIVMSGDMMELEASETIGGKGLYSVNGGDAICAVLEADPLRVVLSELITNPMLLEISSDIDAEIASLIAGHFRAAECVYTTPGPGRCQSMIAGRPGTAAEPGEEPYLFEEAYFGFPIY